MPRALFAMRRCLIVFIFIVSLVVTSTSASAALRYRVTFLAAPAEYPFTEAGSISEDGRIGGTAGGVGRAAVYWAAANDLPVRVTGTGADCSDVRGINSSGVMVGTSMEGFFAYRWQGGDDLQILPGATVCCPRAESINERGAIVGQMPFDPEKSSDFAALWMGEMVQNLGAAPGHVTSIGLDISNAGHIVGRSNSSAARWVNGQVNGQGEVLTGLENNFSFSNGVNNHGDIAGEMSAIGPIGFQRPFLWRNHTLTELPLLGGNFGWAEAINDDRFIVGSSAMSPPSAAHAALWRDGEVIDLNARVVNLPSDALLSIARDINNASQIVGLALINKQTFFLDQAYVLDPIADADVNFDGAVNVDDLLAVIIAWGACPARMLCHADVVEDGAVNVDDLLGVIIAWGS